METNGMVTNGYSVRNRRLSNGNTDNNEDLIINGNSPSHSPTKECHHNFIECHEEDDTSSFCQIGIVHKISYEEVPMLFREPNVFRGFRPLHKPWWYYPLTTLHLHNESMNVWTHLLASLLMMVKLVRFSFTIDFINDPYTWPLLAGLSGGMALYGFSSMAHCMQSKSELYHYTAFMVDYAGIGLYGLGSVIVHLTYCSEDVFYKKVSSWFIPVGCVLAFSICFCCTIAKVIYTRPYPFTRKIWQMAPVAGIYVLLISPILHRLVTYYFTDEEYIESLPYHVLQIIWFCLSGLFFASDIPQRFFPGKCDYFFHSHQLFHIAIMICTLYQMEAVYLDFLARRELVMTHPTPTLWSAFGPILVTIAAEALSIFSFWFILRRSIQSQDLKNKGK